MRARGISWWSAHQLASDCTAPTSICASIWMPWRRAGSASPAARAPGSSAISAATSAVTCATIRPSSAATSGSVASRNSIRQATRWSSTKA